MTATIGGDRGAAQPDTVASPVRTEEISPMHERPSLPPEHGVMPPPRADAGPTAATGLDDPRALQILSTEHWSLLATRSLIWT